MPNTPVRAAAEGMPDVTRRNALAMTGAGLIGALVASLAATPAKSLSIATPAVAMPEELPVDRVNRIAWELADALNTYADGRFHAEVRPSLPNDYPVMFVHTRSRDEARTIVSAHLTDKIEAHRAALTALNDACHGIDAAALGRQPTKAADDAEQGGSGGGEGLYGALLLSRLERWRAAGQGELPARLQGGDAAASRPRPHRCFGLKEARLMKPPVSSPVILIPYAGMTPVNHLDLIVGRLRVIALALNYGALEEHEIDQAGFMALAGELEEAIHELRPLVEFLNEVDYPKESAVYRTFRERVLTEEANR